MKNFLLAFIGILIIIFSGCDPNRIVDESNPIEASNWFYDKPVTLEVEIEDTTISYNLYVNVRHAFHYQWRNLWVDIETTLPDGKTMQKKVNLPMADQTGKWYGKCLGDICDAQVLIQERVKFQQKGIYEFSIEQSMRENPISMIMEVGLRVEKAVN